MMPVVHGLEKQYAKRLDVLYFDISDAKYKQVQQKLKFKSTPHFILLTAKGERVREWTGVISEEVLKTSIDDVLKDQR
jgi:thioredoxin-related protein